MALDRLTSEVSEATTVMASAAALIAGLAEKVRAGAGDKAAMNALADELDASSNSLSAAVVANTESEEEPPTEEPVE